MCRVSSQSTTSASRSSRSTRSVTSSRLPIGVAQTASGTSARPSSASNADKRGADRDRPRRAELPPRRSAARASAGAHRLDGGDASSAGSRSRSRPRRDAEPAADDRRAPAPKMFTKRADAAAEQRGRCRRAPRRASGDRPSVALLDERRGVGARAPAARARRGRPRCRRRTPPGGRGPCRCPGTAGRPADDDVPELRPAAVRGRPSRTMPPPTPVPSVSITRSSRARPAPSCHSASAATFPSFSTTAGRPKRSRIASRKSTSCERDVDGAEPRPVRRSICDGMPKPTATSPVVEQLATVTIDPSSSAVLRVRRRRDLVRAADPRRVDDACEDLRPAEVDADDAFARSRRGYHTPPDGGRRRSPTALYRGGRIEGKSARSSARARTAAPSRAEARDGRADYRGPGGRARRRRIRGSAVARSSPLLARLLVLWGVAATSPSAAASATRTTACRRRRSAT